MSQIIKDRAIVDDQTVQLRLNEDGSFADVPAAGVVVVPLKQWQAQRDALIARGNVGVWLASDEEAEDIAADLAEFALIALDFPAFTDGRSYSNARLLRDRYQYKGELRAIGDVFKDVILYMKRCGFNAFAVRADKDINEAFKGLDDFTEYYQGATDQPLPLFRRRSAAH
ncbi:DUF934 domain-containing protein [Silvimonas amylolytica]|uniref:Oxidoreductase n=1 Tax=Silvimonas amylolytica TaxID=449663 RepID=A0ABQ2PLZ6_9NEIS|nr:DUF934 domain-containing protein [Silvimonas amylolytica]GGP26298.1 oxidoreductase [Silvimonas amylolytica]